MRKARVKILEEGAVYHCIGRLVGGEMLLGDLQKEMLSVLIRRQARFCGIEVITHCVMSNHFHLLVRVPKPSIVSDAELVQRARGFYHPNSMYLKAALESYNLLGSLPDDIRDGLLSRMGDLSSFMKELKQRYSKWHNRRSDRFGTLWAERFKSVLVEDQPSVVLTVAAYIDLNPVRAGLVEDPKDYRWCGYAEATVGIVGAQEGYQSFHESKDWKSISRQYRQVLFVRGGVSASAGKRTLTVDSIRKVLEQNGELALPEVLRLRVRYFSEGVAIGSKAYVDGVYREFRDRFGDTRRTFPRPMFDVGGLANMCTLRRGGVG
jgi:putative transposase